jgi:hexosaminidase
MRLPLVQLFLGCFAFAAAAAETNAPAIIPIPQEMTVQEGTFTLASKPEVLVDSDSRDTAEFLAARLRTGTGYPVKVTHSSTIIGAGNIWLFTKNADPALGPEGYELTVSTNAVEIRAATQAGLFYGAQTLLQLFPPEILATNAVTNQDWTIPCVHVRDQPRFVWRGLMLDVSRHFFTKPEVEQILDAMALYKLNMFHFHLVDDEGWRIEIKKYPRLTEIGAWRNGIDYGLDPKASTAWRADGKYGGYYTQKDIRELVRYAAARHITIVPEIEMPGHSGGALVPYPQYSCTGGPFSNDHGDTNCGAVFCPGNEETYTFLENILSEVFELFPGQFVHVGGDEVSTRTWKNCPKCQALMKKEGFHDERQLQSYLIQRIERYVNAHGKRLIGWSEIREGGLATNAAVMDWIGGGAEAASEGHDVVMSPSDPVDYCYLDHYQSHDHSSEPKAIGGFLPLQQVYRFEPMPPQLAPSLQSHVLGGQGNLWTEYVPNLRHVEYMIFPRECAMAEVLWSPASTRNWDDFLSRIKVNEQRLDALGVNYRHDPARVGDKNSPE